MSNPGPTDTLPPEYDEYKPDDYDPNFTADISSKMRVPHRLSAVNGLSLGDQENMSGGDTLSGASHASMSVPDRILVAGQDQHIGAKARPNLNIDLVNFADANSAFVGLETPPRVLTLEETKFPIAGEDNEERNIPIYEQDEDMQHIPIQHHATPKGNVHMVETPVTPGDGLLIQNSEDDLFVLRRQMSKMSRKVAYLEQENDRRSQRELVLYPLIVGYLLFKMAAWLLKNN